jgi:hypothetical protein
MKVEVRKRLNDFIERVELMRSYSHFNDPEKIIGFVLHKVEDGWQVDFYQPDREKTDAILFNLRLFVANKDDISIGRMAELCTDPEISERWKNAFLSARNILYSKLDMIAGEGPRGQITYRDVFEMVLFGVLGHRSEKDRSYKLFKKWVTNEKEWSITYNMFHDVVLNVVNAVSIIANASKKELAGEQSVHPIASGGGTLAQFANLHAIMVV